MLVKKSVKEILNNLAHGKSIDVPFDGSNIVIRTLDETSKLSLTALIFDGGDYIPKSVRNCISQKSPFSHSSILTFLSVDEKKFQVKLNYLGMAKNLNEDDFKELLGEFSLIAEKWRIYLDEHGKNDLLHVRVK